MLKRMTDEALQAELDRRKAEREEEAKPRPVAEPDWSRVKLMAIDHVERALRGERREKDVDHYIYEQVLETMYGADIWEVLNAIWS